MSYKNDKADVAFMKYNDEQRKLQLKRDYRKVIREHSFTVKRQPSPNSNRALTRVFSTPEDLWAKWNEYTAICELYEQKMIHEYFAQYMNCGASTILRVTDYAEDTDRWREILRNIRNIISAQYVDVLSDPESRNTGGCQFVITNIDKSYTNRVENINYDSELDTKRKTAFDKLELFLNEPNDEPEVVKVKKTKK